MTGEVLYYIAAVIERDIYEERAGKRLPPVKVVDAGVDLLAGPFATRQEAEAQVMVTTRRLAAMNPRYAAFLGLATYLPNPPAELRVVSISRNKVLEVNARLLENVTRANTQRERDAIRAMMCDWPPEAIMPDARVVTTTPERAGVA